VVNILIYINDSLGELDWIAPFIKSIEGKKFNFYIFLNGPGKTYTEKIDILKVYGLVGENIYTLNKDTKLDRYLFQIDNFLNKVLARVQKYSRTVFTILRSFVDIIRYFVASLDRREKEIKFQYIFRDYNLKESFTLSSYIVNNSKAKIVIYPHAVGLQKKHIDCPREPVKKVKADLWLENSNLSDLIKESKEYKDIFFASGSPSLSENYDKKSLFNSKSKNILIITRDCGKAFGFEYTEAFEVFKKILLKSKELSLNVIIKHHPRDRKIDQWRSIQSNFSNIKEFDGSLNDIEMDYKACFTLFSTAGLFALSRCIPIIEFSPYKSCKEYDYQMPVHYCNNDGLLTHDLLDLRLFYRLSNIENFEKSIEPFSLEALSNKQFNKCKTIFPSDANRNIANKLIEIIDAK